MRLSEALRRALDADIKDQNERLRELLERGALGAAEAHMARRILRCNYEELRDPVMGPYHRGDAARALATMTSMADGDAMRYKAYRLAIAASFGGDWETLRAMRDRGVRICALRGRHGFAAGYSVDYPACLAEFLDDGMDPNAEWTVDGKPSDLMTRAAEVNGRPDVIRALVSRGARCTSRALLRALERDHDDAAAEILRAAPDLTVPWLEQPRSVLAALCRVQARVLGDARREAERAAAERDRARAEHDRFVSIEFPALLTQAIASFSTENAALRRALETV